MFLKSSPGIFRSHRTVVEEVLLDGVGKCPAIFGIRHELLVQKLRIEVLRFCSGGERPIAVFANVQQSMFTVMLKVSEALATQPIANCKEVIDSLIAQESGNWSIEISAVKDAHHVHNEIVDVDQHIFIRNRRIIHAIGVLALKSKVVGIVSQIQRGCQLMQSIKRHGISIRCIHRV